MSHIKYPHLTALAIALLGIVVAVAVSTAVFPDAGAPGILTAYLVASVFSGVAMFVVRFGGDQ